MQRTKFGAIAWLAVVSATAAFLVQIQGNAAVRQDTAPSMPFVDAGACPGEGCIYRDWQVLKVTPVYEYGPPIVLPGEPNKTLFTLSVKETVTAMTGAVVVEKAGRARVKQPITMGVRHRQFPREPPGVVRLAPGDVVYLLTYHGEGEYTAWFNGRLGDLDSACFSHPPGWTGFSRCAGRDGEILEEVVAKWWVKIREAKGRIGWTDQPANFGGKDAHGG